VGLTGCRTAKQAHPLAHYPKTSGESLGLERCIGQLEAGKETRRFVDLERTTHQRLRARRQVFLDGA